MYICLTKINIHSDSLTSNKVQMKNKPYDTDKFNNDVYAVISEIPVGKVISYGEIALLLGYPRNSRMVGRALKYIPDGMILPCHRVVNSQGRLAPGWAEQKQLLMEEGVTFRPNGNVDLSLHRWKWSEI